MKLEQALANVSRTSLEQRLLPDSVLCEQSNTYLTCSYKLELGHLYNVSPSAASPWHSFLGPNYAQMLMFLISLACGRKL